MLIGFLTFRFTAIVGAREAANINKRVVYYDDQSGTVESIPQASQNTNCRKVTARVWDKGTLVSEKTEEVCQGTKQTPTPIY